MEVWILALELMVLVLHNSEIWVLEHGYPFLHSLQDLRLDLLMCVSVVG